MPPITSFFLSLFLPFCLSSPASHSTTPLLDPTRLTWWQSKWSPGPIVLSVNNRSQPSTATFYFSVSTTLLPGLFEVTFPIGFDVSAAKSGGTPARVSGQVVQIEGQTLKGGDDAFITISGLSNPAKEGPYGPFALRTRFSPDGQQIDVNLAFGTIYICPDAGSIGPFTVFLSNSPPNNIINRSGNTLSFQFKLGVSLWRYDTFVIDIDPLWRVGAGVECSSADFAGKVNNFNGTDASKPHKLQCVVVGKEGGGNTVYIYGLAVDGIDLASSPDSAFLDLRVTSLTTPSVSGTFYTFRISTVRFSTATVLEASQQTLSVPILPDTISTASWKPTWGMTASHVITGSSYFFDLYFTTVSAIPKGGTVEVQVSEVVDRKDGNWAGGGCFVITLISRRTVCSVDGRTILVTGLPDVPALTSIQLRTLVLITSPPGSTAQILSLRTYQSSVLTNIPIDTSSHLSPFPVSSTGTVPDFSLTYHDCSPSVLAPAAVYTAGGAALPPGSEYFNCFQLGVYGGLWNTVTSSTKFTVICPIYSEITDFQIGIPSNEWGFAAKGGSSLAVAVDSFHKLPPPLPTFEYAQDKTGNGVVSFSGAICTGADSVCQTEAYHLLIYQSGIGKGGRGISLPRVATNVATAYECRIGVETDGQPPMRAAFRLKVTPQPWSYDTSFTVICTSNIDGIPAIFSIIPQVFTLPASTTTISYFLEFEFSGVAANFNSGLVTPMFDSPNGESVIDFAVNYPAFSSPPPTLSKHYYYNQLNFITMSGLFLPLSAPTMVMFPIGGLPNGSIQPKIRSYFLNVSDQRYKYVMHEGDGGSMAIVSSVTVQTFPQYSLIGSASNQIVPGETSLSGLRMNIGASISDPDSYYLYFLFPAGVTWSTARRVTYMPGQTLGGEYSTAYYFSSPSPFFKYPSVLVSSTSPLPLTPNSTTGTVLLAGFTLPLGVQASPITTIMGRNPTPSQCLHRSSTPALPPTPGSITNLMLSPSSFKTRNSNGVSISLSLTFTLQHGIPSGGYIEIAYSSEWATSDCSYCSVSGLFPAGGVVCNLTQGRISVSNFTDFQTDRGTVVTADLFSLFPPMKSYDSAYFVSKIATYTGTIWSPLSLPIDEAASSSLLVGVTVREEITTGRTVWAQKSTYPPTPGAKKVDLYLKFSLPYSVPSCGSVLISSPLRFAISGNVKNLCFLSPIAYKACKILGNNLQITLSQPYPAGSWLELYVDSAVDNPGGVETTSTGFGVIAEWGGVKVDLDVPVRSEQMFTAVAGSAGEVKPTAAAGPSFEPKTAGETATYTFDFHDPSPYTPGDHYWLVFPPEFDYFLGDVWQWFSNEGGTYYIECSSVQLGQTLCMVDHGMVIVSGGNVVGAGRQVVVEVAGIVNPAAGPTSPFQLYHISPSGTPLSLTQNLGISSPLPPATPLSIRSLVLSDPHLSQSSTYTWRLYLSDTITTDTRLEVLFPKEFDIQGVSFQCFSTYIDSKGSQQQWNAANECFATGNRVYLPPPKAEIRLTSSNIVNWTIFSIPNPKWTYPRLPLRQASDFDVSDPVLNPFPLSWSTKLTVYLYHSSAINQYYSSRSYANMNSAYFGYLATYRSFVVNKFDPKTKKNRIIVRAGSQTEDILIATEDQSQPLAVKKVTFQPSLTPRSLSASPLLQFTSIPDNWTILEGRSSLYFRISADIDTPKGVYSVNWAISEYKASNYSEFQYVSPPITLIEVLPALRQYYGFTVQSVSTVDTGSTTPPIRVYTPNAPNSDVSIVVSISVTDGNVNVFPSVLRFEPNRNEKFFQIQVGSAYNRTKNGTITVIFTVYGTDSAIFATPKPIIIAVTEPIFKGIPGNIVSWRVSEVGKTTASVSPTADQIGVIYYHLAAAGNPIPSFSALKTSLFGLSSNQTVTNDPIPEPKSTETWVDFQRRVYTAHLSSVWIGAIPMVTTVYTGKIRFGWLFAGTRYLISGYLDNLGQHSTEPSVCSDRISTVVPDDCQPIAVRFAGKVDSGFSDTVRNAAAEAIGVTPLRLTDFAYSTGVRRTESTNLAVKTTEFRGALLPDRGKEGPAPSQQAQLSPPRFTAMSQSLAASGIPNSVISLSIEAVPQRITPVWTTAPTATGQMGVDFVSIAYQVSIPGTVCCIAGQTTAPPTAEQVMLGLDYSNRPVAGQCVARNETVGGSGGPGEVQIAGLQAGKPWYVFCTAMDAFPMWPTQMEYSDWKQMGFVTVETMGEGGEGGEGSGGMEWGLGAIAGLAIV